MQRIPLKLAAPGMVTARDVSTEEGQVLCGAGVELTQEFIDRLGRMGVASITVEGHPVCLPGEKGLGERIRDLDYRFSRVKKDPVLRALMKLIAEYWIEKERGPQPRA